MGKKQKLNEAQHTEPADIRGLDERSMIREQDRLAREKRKRKNRKKKRITAAVAVILLAGGIWYFFWGKNLFIVQEETSVKITSARGQEITYARLTSVKGNEISYAPAQEPQEDRSESGPRNPREMAGSVSSGSGTFTYDGVSYRVTDETLTAQIPVGTKVTTKLGTITTFSRLAAGDCVALVTQKDGDKEVIVAVYIIG